MVSKQSKYSVILPTYNEKENLPVITFLLMEMAEQNKLDFEVIIVDDNSPDGTGDIAKKLQKHYPGKIQLLQRPGKLGLGTAYIDGMKLCTGDFVVIMDADFSHHPKYLPEFIKKQKETGADIVTGSRYRRGGGVYGWDLYRKMSSRVGNFIAGFSLGLHTSDLTGSFRLYKKEVLQVVISDIISKGYAFQMEIVARAQHKGYKIAEVPIVFVDRIFGDSKFGAEEIATFLSSVWKLLWAY